MTVNDIKTKFNIGDRVYYPSVETEEIVETCPCCKGKGTVEVNGYTLSCSCYGGKKYHYKSTSIPHLSTIGKIDIEIYKDSIIERYMLVATGVGSGCIWEKDALFQTKNECEDYINKTFK